MSWPFLYPTSDEIRLARKSLIIDYQNFGTERDIAIEVTDDWRRVEPCNGFIAPGLPCGQRRDNQKPFDFPGDAQGLIACICNGGLPCSRNREFCSVRQAQ